MFAAAKELEMPDIPAPITKTSASNFLTSLEPSVFSFIASTLKSSGFPPAAFIHSAAATKIPLLEFVAPLIVSTAKVCPSAIAFGILAIASSDIPLLSECLVTSADAIFPSLTVIVTVNGPLLPSAVPSYVPSLSAPCAIISFVSG
ncbi:hypothetical protein DSECCO2_566240 [anaerobic digester metagenome]